MNKLKASALAFGLTLILTLVFTGAVSSMPELIISPLDGGPLNYHPELVTTAQSPDGRLLVKVFKQRIPGHSRFVGGEIRVYVYDDQDRLTYEKMIGQDGAWDELDNAYEHIQFERDVIRISQWWGRTHEINQTELIKH